MIDLTLVINLEDFDLAIAIQDNAFGIVKPLLESGHDLDSHDFCKVLASHHAGMLRQVLEFCSDERKREFLNVRLRGQRSVLHIATGYPECVSLLLEHGADKSLVDDNFETPYDYAVELGDLASSRMLEVEDSPQWRVEEVSAKDAVQALLALVDDHGGKLLCTKFALLYQQNEHFKAIVEKKGGPKEFCATYPELEVVTRGPGLPYVQEALERRVQRLLNKITFSPDNLKTFTDRLARIELRNAEELELVVQILFSQALAEPHNIEIYADVANDLRTRYPEFAVADEGGKACTFTRVLLNLCQNEHEMMPRSLEPTEEERASYSHQALQLKRKIRLDKMLANMKFLASLFSRKLIAARIIGQVCHDCIGLANGLPEEPKIECVCTLLKASGQSLDALSPGKELLSAITARLRDLKRQKSADGKSCAFSKRIQFQIQDVLALRGSGWKEQAGLNPGE